MTAKNEDVNFQRADGSIGQLENLFVNLTTAATNPWSPMPYRAAVKWYSGLSEGSTMSYTLMLMR